MTIVFQKNGEIIETLQQQEVTEVKAQELANRFNNEFVESSTFLFQDGIKLSQVHDMSDITPAMIKVLTLKLK